MRISLLLLLCTGLFLASCSTEDQVIQSVDVSQLDADMAYLNVAVTTENESAQDGGCLGGEHGVFLVNDAMIVLYLEDGDRRPPEAAVVAEGQTDARGNIKFSELPYNDYMIDVVSAYGETTFKVHPRKGAYTQVLVRL